MKKLYETKEILFAVLWIVIYCAATAPIRGNYGDGSIWMVLELLVVACAITLFVKTNHLEAKYGLKGWPKDMKKYLYFIPLWILTSGNLWDGIAPSYKGAAMVCAVLSMLLVGYVEEMLFRGFLFKAILPEEGPVIAVVISSLTFGIGHIVNLFTGQAVFETMIQIIFAVSVGFVFTIVFYKSGSLYPCIISHGLIDVFAKFGADTETGDWTYFIIVVAVSIMYGIYLCRLKTPETETAFDDQT